jgi:hypothetical protein
MAPKQRMRIANEKASKNVTMRGNVPKSTVSMPIIWSTVNSCQFIFRNIILVNITHTNPEVTDVVR